ncbi:MAG: hypothetical protein Q8P67_02550 [archaeon]|nr:hypothetical protein [archaeon]
MISLTRGIGAAVACISYQARPPACPISFSFPSKKINKNIASQKKIPSRIRSTLHVRLSPSMAYEVDHHGNLSSREGEVNRLLNGYVINSSLTLSPQKNCNDKKGGFEKEISV